MKWKEGTFLIQENNDTRRKQARWEGYGLAIKLDCSTMGVQIQSAVLRGTGMTSISSLMAFKQCKKILTCQTGWVQITTKHVCFTVAI